MIKEFRDRLILSELHRDERIIKIGFLLTGLFFIILLASVLYLLFLSFNQPSSKDMTTQAVLSPSITISPTPSPAPLPTATLTQPPIATTSEPTIKDYFIPFGTGTSQASDWTDVPGLQVTIDFGNYKNIKEIRFEASISIPTANETASVRIYNLTDKHPVWYSEMTTADNNYLVSPPLAYDLGSKVYQIQMKTQLQSPANLNLARIHIILK